MNYQINSTIIAVVVGATVAVATLIIDSIQKQKERKNVVTQMENKLQCLTKEIAELHKDIDKILALHKQQKARRRRHNRIQSNENTMISNDCDTDIDTYSTTSGTDVGDDEFYDCSDLEDDVDSMNGLNGIEDNLHLILSNIDVISELDSESHKVYDTLKTLLEYNSNNVEVVWRFARACKLCADNETNVEDKKIFLDRGLEVTERILDSHQNVNLYKWHAILTGCLSQYLSSKEKIQKAYVYKEYVEKALDMEPMDSLLHHLLGRFKYEVSELSWFERKMAATLFAEPPNATYEDAMEHFIKAEKHSKIPNIENKLFLSKCYISLNRHEEAKECLNSLLVLETNSQQELKIKEEAGILLNKYAS